MTNTGDDSRPQNKSSILGVLQSLRLSGLISLVTIFIFVPGFIIINAYLADFGIHHYSLFRVKYLSAGFLFFAILAVYFVFVWKRIYYAEEDVGKISVILIRGSTSKPWAVIWGLFSMIVVYAENAFGIVFSTSLVSLWLFPSVGTKIIFGLYLFFFLIDYPLNKLGLYNKYPRIMFALSCGFHILCLYVFLAFVKEKEPRTLFWTFFIITVVINFILDLRKKLQPGGSYVTKLSLFDWIWVMVLVIGLSVTFGKELYGEISPAFGGGKPVAVSLMIDQKNIPLFQQIKIKVANNLTEKLFLLLETNEEIYVIGEISEDTKTKKAIRLNKNLIEGISYK